MSPSSNEIYASSRVVKKVEAEEEQSFLTRIYNKLCGTESSMKDEPGIQAKSQGETVGWKL